MATKALGPDTVRCQEVSIFLKRNHEIDLDKVPIPFAPDIAIEVLSPSESALEAQRARLRAAKEKWNSLALPAGRLVPRPSCACSSELRRKALDYLGAGSQEVWLLDHANGELLIHSGAGIRVLKTTDILETPALPGLSASIAEVLMSR